MGTLETVVLTAAIIIIDLFILNEYLKLEEALRKVKEGPTPQLAAIAEEVVAPLEPVPTETVVLESGVSEKSEAERENEKLRAENQVLTETKQQIHTEQLDELGKKIDDIAESVKNTKEKVAQFS